MLKYVQAQSGSMKERLTSYFLKLEATHQNSNNIKSIRKGQEFITKSNDILGELCNFYTDLYQSIGIHENNIKTYLDKVHFVNILDDEEKQSLELFPTINE